VDHAAYDLERFVHAQDDGGTFDRAMDELASGTKRSHWMWFVFPQLAGLGTSATARHFAISSLDEATAYLRHPVLGDRLRAATARVLAIEGREAVDILGPVDAMKLRSSMTLFARAEPTEPLWVRVLDRYYAGAPDARTEELLGRSH
jgi:uncharacterized protein (DUF1810 family)